MKFVMYDFSDKNVSDDFLDSFGSLPREMKIFLDERFKKNISAFKKFFPEIASFFNSYIPSKKMEFICGQNGIPNLFFCNKNVLFYNTQDPIRYCKECVDTYLSLPFNVSNYSYQDDCFGQIYDKYLNECLKNTANSKKDRILFSELDIVPLCVITGLGLGYILGELYERVSVSSLVIVEHDPDLFFASLHAFDWEHFLRYIFSEHLSIDIIIGSSASKCFDTLSEIIEKRGCYLSCSLLSVIHYKNEFINEFSNLLKTKFELIPNLLGFYDDYLFDISHCYHALESKKHFVASEPSTGVWENCPVFIIGAGPSLDNDIEFLQKYQNKAIVIACGSSLDSLYNVGIKPDFFANTERDYVIANLLNSIPDKAFFDDIILICSEVCHPLVQDNFKKTLLFGKNNEPFFKYLRSIIDDFKEIQPIEYMNPMVGNMGVSSSLFLGFKNIYLFGLDNGKKSDKDSIHTKYASFFKNNSFIEESDLYKMTSVVPGNFGGGCLTNTCYLISIENMERVIEQFNKEESPIHVINCSDGALIRNATPVHSKKLDSIFQSKPIINKKEICKYLFEKKSKQINYNKDEFNKILLHKDFSNICSIVITKLEQMLSINTRQELYTSISNLSILLNTSSNPTEKFCKEMLESSMQAMFIEIFNASVLRKNFSDCIAVCRLMVYLSIDFVRECDELFIHLPDYILGEHRKFFKDDKVGRDMPHCKAPLFPKDPFIKRTN